MTEVGAYEAINIVTASSSSAPMADGETMPDDIQYYLQDDLNTVRDSATISGIPHSFDDENGDLVDCKPPHRSTIMSNAAATKGPKTIKCPQCRRVRYSTPHRVYGQQILTSFWAQYFATMPELNAHLLVRHSPEMAERFKCQDCQQAFSSQGSLYKHQKIHTGERPFVCQTCNKSFNQLANLQRHFMVHTGEKPFACETCGKQFSQQSNLDKHQVTHSSKAPPVHI